MIQVAPGTKVHLACRPVSMRYGFDGLAAKVASVLDRDPFSGHLFCFRSKRGDYLKILYWDGSGLCLFAKRLERGRFVWPPIVDGGLILTPAQLALLLEAIDWRRTVAPPPAGAPDGGVIDDRTGDLVGRQVACLLVEKVMPSATAPLPSIPKPCGPSRSRCRRRSPSRERELAARDAELHAKTLHIEKLRATLALMRRARFGRSSEKLERAIDQLELLIGDLEEAAAEEQARSARLGLQRIALPRRTGAPRPRGRQPLPGHLPRETGGARAGLRLPGMRQHPPDQLGEDEREVLEYVPSHFKVVLHVRPRMSCRACETITQVPAPSLPIERGRPGPGLLAHVLVAKYCDHVPLHRQSVIYARAGVELERSTLADWVGQAAFLLEPLAAAIGRHVRAGAARPRRRHAGAGARSRDAARPRPADCGCWSATSGRGVGRRRRRSATSTRRTARASTRAPCSAPAAASCTPTAMPASTVSTNPTGERHGAAGRGRVLGHAAAKLFDVHAATGSAIAKEALERIAALFQIEAEISGRAPEAASGRPPGTHAAAARRAEGLSSSARSARISRKSSLAQAIRYALSRWPALCPFTIDGRLEMTNNAAERAIRPLALGRKNYLFAGSDAGGSAPPPSTRSSRPRS